jgi:hypothetical protein
MFPYYSQEGKNAFSGFYEKEIVDKKNVRSYHGIKGCERYGKWDLPERFSGKDQNSQTGGNAADPIHADGGQGREAELSDPRAFIGFSVSGHRRERYCDLWQEEQA